MKSYHIAIVGGGAAGLMAAARCVGSGLDVVLIEKNKECGKKLLITGKGRCNITNSSPWKDFQTHIHPDKGFLKNAFHHFSNKDVVALLESAGLPCKEERGNRIFPVSDRSHDVRDTLVKYIKKGGINVVTGCQVLDINKGDNLFTLSLSTYEGDNLDIQASRVILATGGLSYPTTGSTGDGYDVASKFGHTIVGTFPSLTALKPFNMDSRMEGILLKNVRMDLWVNGSKVQSEFGETLFTSGGIEGALGFRVSRKGVKGLINGQKVELVLDLKPAVEMDELNKRVKELSAECGGKLKKIVSRLVPAQMVDPFIDSLPGLNPENMASRLKEWRFKIVGYVGYERCVVTAGGVSLDEISRKTMESKVIDGLYMAGEVMDLDGDTGGYNLQIAFSTGALAADSAVRSISI
ncbi:MAG: aminoacetone oxidase family FAD-binding enzyme [Bacteroidales bacterium]|nr:aminoacetone oxidase family FAD-binding enzyme [Bacteroidales bacterium]